MMYKLVHKKDDKFFSYLGSPDTFKFSLEYKIGEWTYPKIGKLFIFDNLTEAQYHATSSCSIFECECINIKPSYLIIDTRELKDIDEKTLDKFWTINANIDYKKLANSPYGARYCDAIKLIKEIVC